jgi:hypothetical protein
MSTALHTRAVRTLLLLLITGCFGSLELEGDPPPYGGPFDLMQAEALWSELEDRESWAAFTGREGMLESEDPHGPFGTLHANSIAVGDPVSLPFGSVIAKHAYDDTGAVTSITAVKRIDNFNPEAFDWFWARYTIDGELTFDEDGHALGGAIAPGCIDCHRDAPGGDFVFTNGGS